MDIICAAEGGLCGWATEAGTKHGGRGSRQQRGQEQYSCPPPESRRAQERYALGRFFFHLS